MMLLPVVAIFIISVGPIACRCYEKYGIAATAMLFIAVIPNLACIKLTFDIIQHELENLANPNHGEDEMWIYILQKFQDGWFWFAGMLVCFLLFIIFGWIHVKLSEDNADIRRIS